MVLRLAHGKVYLRAPAAGDFEAWAQLRGGSRAFLQPWEPTWADDEFSRSSYRTKLKRYAESIREDRGYPWFVFRVADHALVGGATLSNVRRGVSQCATLGYWVGEMHQRRGYTRDAVMALIAYSFGPLGLHRLEAACQPENDRSRALLERVGFRHEGLARSYLRIDGAWRDHLLFGLVDGDGPREVRA
jgi:ribosomal-protein-alanine N-acetyltransferase